ncbi:hypothetical protein INR49_005801 [Caranx melampygus]|nr:hypothetical protein INR49_005801 [Caranx melampygus]
MEHLVGVLVQKNCSSSLLELEHNNNNIRTCAAQAPAYGPKWTTISKTKPVQMFQEPVYLLHNLFPVVSDGGVAGDIQGVQLHLHLCQDARQVRAAVPPAQAHQQGHQLAAGHAYLHHHLVDAVHGLVGVPGQRQGERLLLRAPLDHVLHRTQASQRPVAGFAERHPALGLDLGELQHQLLQGVHQLIVDFGHAAGALGRHHSFVHQLPRLGAQLLDGQTGRMGGVLLQVPQQTLHLLRRPLPRPLQLRLALRVHLVHLQQQPGQLSLQPLVVAVVLQAAEERLDYFTSFFHVALVESDLRLTPGSEPETG